MTGEPFVRSEHPAWDGSGMSQGIWAGIGLIPITIGAMIGCIALSAVALLEQAVPGWNGTFVVLFCSMAAVEAAYSYRLYRRDLAPGTRRLLIQVAELTTLCVIRQVWETVLGGQAPLAGGVPRFDPRTAALFFLTSGLIFLSWWSATALMRCLDEPARPWRLDAYPAFTQRRLAGWCLLGGVILFLLAGLSQAPFAATLRLPTPARSGPALTVLLYCALGMTLLVQAQQSAIVRRQERRDIIVADGFSARLQRHTIPLIALVAILAVLIPNSRLLNGGQAAWSEIAAVVGSIDIDLPIHGASDQPASQPVADSVPCCPSEHPYVVPPNSSAMPPASNGWNPLAFIVRLGPLMKIILLWLVLLASVAYRVRRVGRRKSRPPDVPVPPAGLFRFIRGLWSALWGGVRGSVETLGRLMPGEIEGPLHLPQPPAQRSSFPRMRRLSPREHVLHSFLRFLREAKQRGYERDPSQTPQEFCDHLSSHLTEGRDDIEALTQAFVAARYSAHEVEDAEIERVRSSRKRARAALRSFKAE